MKALKKPKLGTKPSKKSSPRTYQAEKHLRKFCNVTSQELGNVLGAIVGELDYALSHHDERTRESSMRISLSAAERALNLARNLRYFAVHTRLDVQATDVAQILLDTVDMLEKDLESHGIQLSVLAEASAYATCDGAAIQQVILNLLSNSAHAMPQGGKLTLSLRRIRQSLEIRCTDTGVGIAPEHLERVFEPYFIAGSRAFTESMGLGLAVTKALVEAHGGEIAVESRVGGGTTFTLHLPCENEGPRPSPFREKRRYRRVNVTLPVEITLEGQPTLRTELSILSVGGCFVRLPEGSQLSRVERNQPVKLRILYYGDEHMDIPRARIASHCRVGMHSGAGIEFLEIDAKAQKLLAALVKSHSS
jgi:anti-sigma regulatory factor (Ser/Thr protein kinase)